MTTITIPKNLIKEKDLILIPRRKYEELLDLEKIIKIVKSTKSELQVIERGRKEIKKGKHISWHELKQELAYNNN
ncbi:MAG: hypothetical protein HYV52_00750 [Parcubacteria group bacterium]|nr:hypothetical protein [Parcubacteria group bacterium]